MKTSQVIYRTIENNGNNRNNSMNCAKYMATDDNNIDKISHFFWQYGEISTFVTINHIISIIYITYVLLDFFEYVETDLFVFILMYILVLCIQIISLSLRGFPDEINALETDNDKTIVMDYTIHRIYYIYAYMFYIGILGFASYFIFLNYK